MAFENLQLGVKVEQRQEVKWFGITFDLNCLRLLYFVNVILKDLFSIIHILKVLPVG